ncbi:protein of unknown function DUF483 [Methanothermus fervidus DSM 2088]|uniref:DUF483 domain-containing protein n=1 Tax=Methanothermus fervidus (strain ATCC 43054 / DSM 2088 / JCM 10308 / V24 S) TaxID=523846 RepID=E3GZJ1_METFV|nr:DUF483 domain-containing protein [Methanothermus fervidus]ADP77723.1 protein of unknown function DUF483 [Methanothermus fervidus DSM 2088]
MNGVEALNKICKKILEIRKGQRKDIGPGIIRNMEDFHFNYLIDRLKLEIEIVKKYSPKVRPAIDPVVSTELGIYRGYDVEVGKLLGYPICCIKSFLGGRISIDENHLKEISELKVPKNAYAIIMPSGFIPCSLKCKKAWKRRLINFVTKKEYENILKLEKELITNLLHFHPAYDEYYEKILLSE